MGIWRTLYREIRVILGFPPPAENATQLAERVCGEVKGELGGKKTQNGEDWFLETSFQGRTLKVLFSAEGRNAVIAVSSSLEEGPPFMLVSGQSSVEVGDGAERKSVASGVFVEGQGAELSVMLDLWKALPTGTRGNLSALVNKWKGIVRYEDGAVRLEPEVPMLDGPSAKYTVKSVITTMMTLTGEMETAWSNL